MSYNFKSMEEYRDYKISANVHCGGISFEVNRIVYSSSEWDAKITFNRTVYDDYPGAVQGDIEITKIEKIPTNEEKNMITKEQVIENIKFAGSIKKKYENLSKALSSIKIENDVQELTKSVFELKDSLSTMLEILEAIDTYDEIDDKLRRVIWDYGDFDFNPKTKEIVLYCKESRHIRDIYDLNKDMITSSNSQDPYNNCSVQSDGKCYQWKNETETDYKFKILQEFCEQLPKLEEAFNVFVYIQYVDNDELNKLKELSVKGVKR